jgi:putative spermidine/putrescine transport system ATP-binding protein
LARALVNEPRVLLLDEPLGALDLKLREQMQMELKTLHNKLGITFIYVTHDQGEALSMSNRVAVFNHGRIEQVDHPRNLYSQPKTSFVADFVGTSNIISGNLAQHITGNSQPFSIRPEHINIHTNQAKVLKISGEVADIQYHGATSKIEVTVAGQLLSMVLSNTELTEEQLPKIGQKITLCWSQSRMVMLEN